MHKKNWTNSTAKDVVTIGGSIWNDDTRTVANALNYNAQILKDALNRIAELEKIVKPQEESEGTEMNKELAKLSVLSVKKSSDYSGKVVKALEDAGFVIVRTFETSTEDYYIVAEKVEK